MRLGIIDQSFPGWTAGEHYTRMLLSCLALANQQSIGVAGDGSHAVEIVLLRGNEDIEPPSGIRAEELVYIDRRSRYVNGRALESLGLDVVFPAGVNCVETVRLPAIGWIPDFQHYTHSEFFSEADFVWRSVHFNAIAENYPIVLLSSESAKHDFVEFLPRHSAKARVARFTSSLWTAKLDEHPQDAVGKYHLPGKYALVSNQLWVHKNHKILPAAFSIARKKGLRIPLVMTGVPADYRDPENQLLSNLLQDFATRGLADQVHLLGKLPFADLISITRCATVIVQPSLCEGWNTLIEDAKALGRPIICSDIDVHREQAPSALGHFSPLDPDGLSKILLDHFADLEAGPCLSLEAEMLELTRMRARDFGNLVLRCAREVFEQKQERDLVTPRRNGYLYQKQQDPLSLRGRSKFRIANWAQSLVKREKDAPSIAHSSESAKHDFVEGLPRHSAKPKAAQFTSSLWTAKLDERPQDAVAKYHLPEKYALVSNQWWLCENQEIFPAALSIARTKGLKIPLVMAGVPADSRDPENRLLSKLLQDFATRGLADQVHFLGKLPFADLISIIRCATVIVEPSLCEGWNTIIEDAKALGRPIICSDTDVHREQAPSALGHFSPRDPGGLAKILLDHFADLEAGPCLSREAEMLVLTRKRAGDFEQKPKSDLVRPRRNNYLYQKQQHALYLWGKLKFRIVNFARSLGKREKDAPLVARLMKKLNDGYRCDYWKLSQYAPRALRAEVFPRWRLEASKLPSLAIVTPSFNQADSVKATIESVLGQGYPALRYAVVDGGSTDGSVDAIRANEEHLAYFVSESDAGQCDAVRKGFENIAGEIMAYLNSDDLLMPGALRFVGEYFALHQDVDVIYGHRVIVDANGNEIGRRLVPPHNPEALGYFDFIPQETMFWRRSIYEKVNGLDPEFHFALDWDLILRFVKAGARFRRVPYFLACFRSHVEQKSATIHETVGADEIRFLQRRELSEEPSPEVLAMVSEKFARRAHCCHLLMQHGMRA
jgi:glycosyltransferase involved in cell wall biosynthesis